jgi:hypothetical protein
VVICWLEEVPLFLSFELQEEGVDVIVVRRKALFLLLLAVYFVIACRLARVRCNVRISACVTLKDLIT